MMHSTISARGLSVPERPIDWSAVLANIPDGFVCTDERARIIFANRAAERMLGRRAGTLANESLGDVIAVPADASSGDFPMRAMGKRADGSLVAVEVAMAHHDLSPGQMTSVVLRELSANDRALSSDALAAERQAFLSMVAHQLRAPIQPILNSLRTIDLAVATGKTPPSDTMTRAMRQAIRLGRLVNAILNDALAIERGNLEVFVNRFDIAVFTRDIIEDFRLASPEHRIEYTGPPSGVFVFSDEERVHQILIGLIDNALKYSEHKQAVKVTLVNAIDCVHLQVIDRGIGIPAAEQARVFAKFYRGSNVPTATTGLGVGLFLAHGLAQRLHGSLTVKSELGQGSIFSLVLPKRWPERISTEDRGGRVAPLGNDGNVRSPS